MVSKMQKKCAWSEMYQNDGLPWIYPDITDLNLRRTGWLADFVYIFRSHSGEDINHIFENIENEQVAFTSLGNSLQRVQVTVPNLVEIIFQSSTSSSSTLTKGINASWRILSANTCNTGYVKDAQGDCLPLTSGPCSCQPGFARDASGWCQPCAANFFCTGGDAAPAACPPDAASPPGSGAVAACACNAGFQTIMPLGVCADDPTYTQTHYDWMTFEEFTLDCTTAFGPGGSYVGTCTSHDNQPNSAGCVRCCASCRDECAGIWTDPAWAAVKPQPDPNAIFTCRACPAGKYQIEKDCVPCPAFTSSPVSSSRSSDCVCNAGYTKNDQLGQQHSICTACAVGKYKATQGPASCQTCPSGSTNSLSASTSVTECECAAGYTSVSGSCQACAADTYKAEIGNGACISCQANSASAQASISNTNCLCNAGYTQNGQQCTACPAGAYKTSPGSAPCTSCPDNSGHLQIAQTQATACQCYRGFTGPNGGPCTACQALQFKNTNGSAACTACPPGSSSPAASNACVLCAAGKYRSASESVCTDCVAGKYSTAQGAVQASNCVNCIAGKYSSTSGAAAESTCLTCPHASTSIVAGGTLDYCHCAAGTAAPITAIMIGSGCHNVPDGAWTYMQEYHNRHVFRRGERFLYLQWTTWMISWSITPHSQYWKIDNGGGLEFIDLHKRGWHTYGCGSGSFSMTQDVTQCTACPAGQYARRGFHLCLSCAVNTYSTEKSSTCLACPPNSGSSAGSASCQCNAGYSRPDSAGVCTQCAAGTYELGRVCLQCPLNSNSGIGASGLAACLCRPGYFGPPGGPCRPCTHGSYSDSNKAACTACGPNANTSAPAATNPSACLCQPGHAPLAAACSPCRNDTYKATLDNTSCTACTAHSTSPQGSTSANACACSANFLKRAGNGTCARVCAAGFEAGGASLTECVGCRPGAYKTLEGDHACTPCPPNAFSLLANQTSVSSCICQHGFTWNAATQLCNACPPGTFNNRANESQCFVCVSSIPTSSSTACTGLALAPAGYQVTSSGANLELCPANSYNNGSAKACTACPWPQTFTTASGLTSVAQCACRPGYERVGGVGGVSGICTACALGGYKADAGDGACAACPAFSTTQHPASANATACVCWPGYERVGPGTCQLTACAAGSAHLLTQGAASCACALGFYFVANVCAACEDGLFKDFIGNAPCSECGPNAVSLTPRANRTACACAAGFEPGLQDGPDVLGGSCVAQCEAGFGGARGVCALCETGKFKPAKGQVCSSCPAPRSSSPRGNTDKSKCSCGLHTFEVAAADMVVVARLGPLLDNSAESLSGTGALSLAATASRPLWRLEIAFPPSGARSARVTVGGRLVFACARDACRSTTLQLHGMRGALNATALPAAGLTLHWRTRRQVVLADSAGGSTWFAAAAAQTEAWAAAGRLRAGAAVFKNSNVFSTAVSACAACPAGLRCAAHIGAAF
jgi:hypothetical protein